MNETSKYIPNEDGYLNEKDTKSYYSRIGMFCFLLGAISFAVSMAAIRFLMDFVKKHSFSAFGVYRIALGAAVAAYFLLRA